MSKIQKDTGKSISEALGAALSRLSADQVRFVVARQDWSTDAEAAESIGMLPDTIYHWENKRLVNEAVQLMAQDSLAMALHLRQRNLAKAMAVKVAGLDSDDEHVRQKVATEIIEWELGKATQRHDMDVTVRDRERRRRQFEDLVRQMVEKDRG